ncbi:MAG TPA: sensor histidine kinase [Acidimicrobiales bacterium]|nr:sensor histidine kinase [Acidimicrobiales bacterium]
MRTCDAPAGAGEARRERSIAAGWRLALVVGVAQLLFTHLAGRDQADRYSLDLLGVALLLAGPAALAVRHRYPSGVLVVTLTATLMYWEIGYVRGPIFLALIVAFATAVMHGRRWLAWGSLVVGYVSFLWLGDLLDREPAPNLAQVVGLGAWLLALATTTEVIRARRERAAEVGRARQEEARRRASEERLRIAQELHDVLAHNISLINVQAGVALHLIDERPEQARPALAAIKDASKEALDELRSVLDVLREGTGDAASLAPAPGLAADLDDLVAKAVAAGVDVTVEVEGERRPLPPRVDRAAFRIAQEALTNVVRHAGGATATVRVTYAVEAVTVEVNDDGTGAPVAVADGSGGGSGNGITGMRERAAALGGRLDAGPRAGGGFRVRAWLPLDDRT